MEADKPVIKGSTIVVSVAGVTRVVMQSLSYAKSLTDNVVAVYVDSHSPIYYEALVAVYSA